MSNKIVIGIDFGTSNTYITFGNEKDTQIQPLFLDGKAPHIPTVILYKDTPDANPNVFPYIGRIAEGTYGMATEKEKQDNKYR